MKNWWNDLALKTKVQIPVQLLLLLILLLGQHFASGWFEGRMLEEVRQKAALSAEVAFRGMSALMLNGEIVYPERRKQVLEGVLRDKNLNIAELRLIRGMPVQDQYGPGAASEQPQDEMDGAALSGSGIQSGDIVRVGEIATLRVVVPLQASRDHGGIDCLQCHRVAEGEVNGAISVVADATGEYAVIRRANFVLWGAVLFIQVVLFFVVGWAIDRVIRPVNELRQVMLGIQGSCDLTRRSSAKGNDEIGQTAQAFDALMDSLSTLLLRAARGAGRLSEGEAGKVEMKRAGPESAV